MIGKPLLMVMFAKLYSRHSKPYSQMVLCQLDFLPSIQICKHTYIASHIHKWLTSDFPPSIQVLATCKHIRTYTKYVCNTSLRSYHSWNTNSFHDNKYGFGNSKLGSSARLSPCRARNGRNATSDTKTYPS